MTKKPQRFKRATHEVQKKMFNGGAFGICHVLLKDLKVVCLSKGDLREDVAPRLGLHHVCSLHVLRGRCGRVKAKNLELCLALKQVVLEMLRFA